MNSKTRMAPAVVRAFLDKQLGGGIGDLAPLVEGESSQAFAFTHDSTAYVVRINGTIIGFQKDAYAYAHFHCDDIPIPSVLTVGKINDEHAFCIATKSPGSTLQDADMPTLERLLAPTFALWQAISTVDIAATSGFGYFDAAGVGQFASWGDYLAVVLDRDDYDWEFIARHVDGRLIDALMARLADLIPRCPAERHLVHGDFGANNILAVGHAITAVLDWDCAKYGDALYDVATAYFWHPWLACMDRQAEYYATRLATLPRYHARIACYQLRIGLAEIYDAVCDQEWSLVAWLVRRCTDILKESDDGRDV